MQQPILRQQALQQRAEGLAHGAAGLVGFFYQRGNFVAKRQTRQRRAQFRNRRRAQDESVPRAGSDAGELRLLQLDGMVLRRRIPSSD